MDAVSNLYQAYKVQISEQGQPDQQQQPQPNFANNFTGMEGTFDYNAVPDVGSLSTNPGAVANWGGDPNSMEQLSGFWDDMMWDTNLPDILEAPFGLGNDYDFQGAAQDSGAPCWMQGN